MLNPRQREKVISALIEIQPELSKTSIEVLGKSNKSFAIGVLRHLCETDFCELPPSMSNKFSSMVFKFPMNINENFLNTILDCVELLSNQATFCKVAKDESEATGYFLNIENEGLIRSLVFVDAKDPWCLAGVLFVQFNKNKLSDNPVSVIGSELFGDYTFTVVNNFNYLSL